MSKAKRDSYSRINTIRAAVRPAMPEFKIPWKNTYFKINNLSVYYKESGKRLVEFYLIDRELPGESLADRIVGHLELNKDYGWPWWNIDWVGVLPEYRGGVISQLYVKIINKYGLNLRSENQSKGAKKVWAKIIESGLVNVYFYNFLDASYSKAGIRNGKYIIDFEEANEKSWTDIDYVSGQHIDLIATKKGSELDKIAKKYIELKKSKITESMNSDWNENELLNYIKHHDDNSSGKFNVGDVRWKYNLNFSLSNFGNHE